MTAKKLVIAIGGNAIQPAGDAGGAESQRRKIEETCAKLADLVQAGYSFVLTHGNGPQVGNILLQNEETRQLVPAMPLDVCGAESQALIGYLIAQALRNEFAKRRIERPVACLITQTLVDANDPAFAKPTKPIGPYYTREADLIVKRAKGWKLVSDPRGGWRRVVPSPQPVDIVEKDTILKLVGDGDGSVVICAGGGGVPVVRREGRLAGVEAVIDKDLAAAVLAKVIGWKTLVIATDVERVALDFGKPGQRFLDKMTLAEARTHLAEGQFPEGSMGPKILAAIQFLESGGEHAVITDLLHLDAAVEKKAGTRIVQA
ncbi:MAG TPA: carbamate kinase [Thermoplasmata archaeon]|nr:carbamate kinase [Thermoplasmata archaeon]